MSNYLGALHLRQLFLWPHVIRQKDTFIVFWATISVILQHGKI